jgi:hypothetical protein
MRELAKEFLNKLGPHWFREFLKMYTAELIRQCRGVVILSDDFYRLGPLLDLIGPQWFSISKSSADFDAALKTKLTQLYERHKRDRQGFQSRPVPFRASHPALFAMQNLVRALALLDKNWKRRVDALPKPNQLARVYSAAELDQMVADMESVRKPGMR